MREPKQNQNPRCKQVAQPSVDRACFRQASKSPQQSRLAQNLSTVGNTSNSSNHALLLCAPSHHQSANKSLLLHLQRQYGNNYVNQVLQQTSQRGKETSSPPGIQAKLTIGPAGDKYEREADRVASDVVQRINAPSSPAAGGGPPVQARNASEDNLQTKSQITSLQREVMPDADELRAQMKPAAALHKQEPEDEMLKVLQKRPASPDKHDLKEEEEEKHPIQKKSHSDPASHALKEHDEENMAQLQPFTRNHLGQAISEATPDLESSIQDARGKGRPLPTHILAPMEQAFGANFSGVKVHTDSHADHLNRAIQARAFTTGQDVFFRQGEFSLGSKRGQELLAHELTHVVQQNGRKTEPKTDSNDSSKDQQLPAPTQLSQIDTSPRTAEPTPSSITDANADGDSLAEPADAGLLENEAAQQEPASDAAPQSAETDPGFQDVVRQAKDVAIDQQDHPPATIKASEAQAAAIPPSNEVESKAQDKQVDEMEAAPIPPFEPKAFKDVLMMRLAEITPKDLKDAENFKNSNKLESVKNDVSSKVETAQQDSKGPLKEKSSQLPDTSGIPAKQVSPLLPNPPGDLPAIIGPEQAAPKAKGQGEVEGPAMARSQSLEQQLATAGITEEQLLKSNEPQFQAALDNKKAAQSHSQNAPQAYRQGEQTDILQAQASAALTSKDKLQGMHGSRSQALAGVTGKQVDGKGKDEQKRTKIADDIDKIYQITKTKVDTKLAQLSTEVLAAFDSGAALAKNIFEVYVAQKMEAYKQKRYAEWGPFGWLRWIGDQIMGLPDEVNRFYEDGRNQYIYFMDGVIEEVAIIVATGLNDAMNDVSTGREEIKRYVSSLPDDLKQIGVEAAEGIQSQFDGLQQDIQNHQDEMIDNLAQKYKENLDAINTRIKELQEANKGLIQKAIDAIVGVITTIIELGKLLLQVLARVAASIGKILLDPIGFLSNLFNALKQGFLNFVKNIGKYLTQGLLGWLTGALSGTNIQFPKSLEDSQGIFTMVTGVLGISYEAIRAKAVRRLGRDGEQKAGYLEQSFEMFRILATQGVVGVWQVIKDRFGDFKSMVLEPITHFITTSVVEAGVNLLIGMMTPATGFIRACKAIYDIIKFVIDRAQQIAALVNSILDAVGLVADGAIEQASLKVEATLADAIPMAIEFMASILGLGDIGQKVQSLLQKLRRPIDRVIDWVIDQGVKAYKSVGKRLKKSKLGKKIGLAKKRAKQKLKAAKQLGKGNQKVKRQPFDKNGKVKDKLGRGKKNQEANHVLIAKRAVSELEETDKQVEDAQTFRSKKQAKAKLIETSSVKRLEKGIKLTVRFDDSTKSETKGYFGFQVIIAPNTTKRPGEVHILPYPKRFLPLTNGLVERKIFQIKARPKFLKEARDIKLQDGQDRRHVLGWDNFIKPFLEKAINGILLASPDGEFQAKLELSEQSVKYGFDRKVPNTLEEHVKFIATRLNSTPNNLNPEAGYENKAIETVRQQSLALENKLRNEFSHVFPEFGAVKDMMIRAYALKPNSKNTLIIEHANFIRGILLGMIEEARDEVRLIQILNIAKDSTGIDLSKKPGSKAQTAFALDLYNACKAETNPQRLLELVFTIRKMPGDGPS